VEQKEKGAAVRRQEVSFASQ